MTALICRRKVIACGTDMLTYFARQRVLISYFFLFLTSPLPLRAGELLINNPMGVVVTV